MSTFSNVLDSTGLQTIATLLAATAAYIVYHTQKRDTKRDVANSLLSEIQHAERSIGRVRDYIRDTNTLDVNVQVLQLNSWPLHKHLFSSDFDKDEWDAITDFYNKAHLLDEAIAYNSATFTSNAEQIRINKQRVLADLAKSMIDDFAKDPDNAQDILKSFNERVDLFDKVYSDKHSEFAYTPVKHLEDAKACLEDIILLSTTSVGTKLKKLAGIS